MQIQHWNAHTQSIMGHIRRKRLASDHFNCCLTAIALRGQGQPNPRVERKCLYTAALLQPFHISLTVLLLSTVSLLYMFFSPLFHSKAPI